MRWRCRCRSWRVVPDGCLRDCHLCRRRRQDRPCSRRMAVTIRPYARAPIRPGRFEREGLMGGREILKSVMRAMVPAILAVSLAGCFDLSQNVSVGRDGTGHYRVAVAAEGFIGQALKSKSDKDLIGRNPARTTTSDINGRVTRVSI